MTEPVLESAYEVYTRTKARGADPAAGLPFEPATSPLHGRAVFLLGAPRSGTTWLQQLLVLHPQIATAGESHVFCEGVGALLNNHDDVDRYSGLSGWVTRPELLGLIRALVDGVLLRLRDTSRPDATHVLDKTPNHVPYAAQVAEVYPDAAFVQIIRDGRDSAASAHDLWSWSSTYSSHTTNAARWRDAVLDCREHLSGLRYCEVRYEELLAAPEAQLARVYDTIGLPHDEQFLSRSAAFGRTPVNVRPSRTELSSRKWERMAKDVERQMMLTAGELLVELGYVTEAHRQQVLSHRSVQRTVEEARVLGGKVQRRSAAMSRGLRSARPDRRTMGKQGGQALADAVLAGDRDAVVTALAVTARLVDGAAVVTGREPVADRLLARLAGHRMLALDADLLAATLRWSNSSGDHQLHRLAVGADGLVTSVTIHGGS